MSREQAKKDFLDSLGWGAADRTPVPGDASTRSYERLSLSGKKAVLMNAPKSAELPTEPEGADEAQRRQLGYNAMARLAGPNSEAFVAIANELSIRGFSAPKIIGADFEAGFVLLEDLGSDLFARVIERDPKSERRLYETAIDTLAAIYRSSFPENFQYRGVPWTVRSYDNLVMLTEVDLCLDWYAKDFGHDISGPARDDWYALWTELFQVFGAHAPGLALRDYHAENLFWLPDRQATSRIGLIDFQDALFAHPAYDLVSLIEDARRDVTPELHDLLIARFCEKAGLRDDDKFRTAYAVMGAQRNSKVIGFPVRADLKFGKPQYRALIPRVQAHLNRNLAHPALKDLRAWYAKNVPEILL